MKKIPLNLVNLKYFIDAVKLGSISASAKNVLNKLTANGWSTTLKFPTMDWFQIPNPINGLKRLI